MKQIEVARSSDQLRKQILDNDSNNDKPFYASGKGLAAFASNKESLFAPKDKPKVSAEMFAPKDKKALTEVRSTAKPNVLKLGVFDAEFYNHNDMMGHTDGKIGNQMQFIVLEQIKEGIGEKCAMNDYLALTWKGFNMDGKLLFDSKKENHGKPMVFRLGHYEVSKCWDVALQ